MDNERNYGIDFLRLVLVFMVCVLHVLGQGGVLSSCESGTISYGVFWFMEAAAFCAVDAFAFISGYTAGRNLQKYAKIVDMWFQAWFYSFAVSLLLSVLGLETDWSRASIIKRCLPLTSNTFWYFTAYVALFFAMPLLNAFMFKIDESTAKKAFMIGFALFPTLGMLGDPFQARGGYSTIWLLVLYCLGALAKRIQLFECRKTIHLILLWLLCNALTWTEHILGHGRLMNYVSPTVLLSAIILVVLFSRIPLRGRIVRKISPLVFGIYLFQLNPVVWMGILYNACTFIASKSLGIGVVWVLACAALIFTGGLIVESIRRKLAQLMRLYILSQKIVDIIDSILTRVSGILK